MSRKFSGVISKYTFRYFNSYACFHNSFQLKGLSVGQNTHWGTWYIKYTPSNTKTRPVGNRNKLSYFVTGYMSEAAADADIDRFKSHIILPNKRASNFEPILELRPLVVNLPTLVNEADDDDNHMAIVPTETQTLVFSPASPGLVNYSVIMLVTRVSYTFFAYI